MYAQSSSSQSTTSTASITQFFRKRISGDIPVFGGNILNGLADAKTAVQGTARYHVVAALSSVTTALQHLQESMSDVPAVVKESEVVVLQDLTCDAERLLECVDLDESRIQVLLEASTVPLAEIEKYKALIYATKDVARKRQTLAEATIVSPVRNYVGVDYVPEEEIALCVKGKENDIAAFAHKLGVNSTVGKQMMCRAFVHDSLTMGRNTNRPLAMIGDAALALLLKQELLARHNSLKTVSAAMQQTQSNVALCQVGIHYRLDVLICAAVNVDKRSKSVMSTTVEAIYGVLYEYGGIPLVSEVNDRYLKIFDLT